MKEYIDRAAAISALIDNIGDINIRTAIAAGCIIGRIPVADVVEVVRCKDCNLMCHDEHGYWCINDYQACLDPEKDYCSRADRRNDTGGAKNEKIGNQEQ